MGISCGVDIIEIDRMKKSFDNCGTAFRDRIFTSNEIEYCEARKKMKYESYAVRFAAKEAVSKAFGTGISKGMGWKDIEVLNDENGRPYVVLWGEAKKLFNDANSVGISLSLSHCESFAVAYVVLETGI